ncbi:MAG: hypothetical protein ACE5H9_11725 [Anaerolineae bacterium]
MTQNPYVGPRAFEEEESPFFFGRDEEIQILAGLVMARRAALFFAQSGAGKSSLLRAGLLPELTRQETIGRGRRARTVQKMQVLPILTVGGGTPAEMRQPIANIYVFSALLALLPEAAPDELAGRSLAGGLAPFFTAPETEPAPFAVHPLDLSTLLIFDQFEELFTHHPTRWPEREDFFHQVGQALEAYPGLHVLFTMREDYIAELTPYASLLPEGLRPRFRMERLKREAALQAIKEPAARAGRGFAAGVAEALVDNLRRSQVGRQAPASAQQAIDAPATTRARLGEYIEPVHLQIVCHQLWDNLPPEQTTILAQDVEEFGDVDQALAEFYETALETVVAQTGLSQRRLRTWVSDHLITSAGTRGLVYRGTTETEGLPNTAIDILNDVYIIRAEKRGNDTWYELAHDRLVEPIAATNRAWQSTHQNPLALATQRWLDSGKDPRKLSSGPELEEAGAYAQEHPNELTEQEKEFLALSTETEQARAARRRQLILWGTVLLLVLFASLTGWALWNERKARVAAGEAIIQANRAATARAEAVEKAIAAAEAEAEAREQAVIAATSENEALQQADVAATAQAEAVAQANAAATAAAEALNQLEDANRQFQMSANHQETAVAAQATAEAEQNRAATLAANLEALLTVQAASVEATPTGTPTPPPPPGVTPAPTDTPPPVPTPPPPTPTPNATVEAIQAQVVQAQASQTVIARSTETAIQATQTAVARCQPPQGALSRLWQVEEIKVRLGCPKQIEPIGGLFAEQPFENGYMFWSEEIETFIVLVGDETGRWQAFGPKDVTWSWNPGGPSCSAKVPPGLVQPIRGFGGIWCARADIREAIGFGTLKEFGVNGDFLQEFEAGVVLVDSNNFVYFLFTDDGTYVRFKA